MGAQGWDLFAPSCSRRGGREVGQVLAEEGEELAMGLGADELSVQCALHGLVLIFLRRADSIGYGLAVGQVRRVDTPSGVCYH